MSKLQAYFAETFPKSMGRGQQSEADFLTLNGWEKQKPQGESPVWKCPVTKSNFLQAEAMRRCEQTPFEDRAIVIIGRVRAERDGLRKQLDNLKSPPPPPPPAGSGEAGAGAGTGGAAT